jgi:hypothetical protein
VMTASAVKATAWINHAAAHSARPLQYLNRGTSGAAGAAGACKVGIPETQGAHGADS